MLIIQLILIQLITFVGLVFVLRRLLFSEASLQVRRLKALNVENEKKSEELKRKIEQQEIEYAEKLKKTEQQTRQLKEEALGEIERQRSQTIERVKEEAKKIITQARNSKERMRLEIESQLQERAVCFAFDLLKNAFDKKTYQKVHRELVESVIQGFGYIDENKITGEVTKAEVRTPFSLESEDKERIEKLISKKAARQLTIEEEIDEDLIAGLVIKLGKLIIDASLFNRLHEVKERLRKNS